MSMPVMTTNSKKTASTATHAEPRQVESPQLQLQPLNPRRDFDRGRLESIEELATDCAKIGRLHGRQ